MHQTRTKTIQQEIVVCDRCHREMEPDRKDFEYQERTAIRFRGGYGSVFGDGNLVEADICQNCLQEIFGKYLRITEDDPFDPKHKVSDEAEKAYQEYQLQQILATENFLNNFREAVQAKQQENQTSHARRKPGKSKGVASMFKDKFLAEWRRLSPVYVKENSGFWLWLGCIFKETVPGYFAPLRMVYWLFTQGGRNAG